MQLILKRRFLARFMLIVVGASLQLGLRNIASAQGNAAMELTLSQAIDLALKQNRSLKMAQLSVVESEQKKKIARSEYFPQISNQSLAVHLTDVQQLVIPEGALGAGRPARLQRRVRPKLLCSKRTWDCCWHKAN